MMACLTVNELGLFSYLLNALTTNFNLSTYDHK